MRIGGRAGQLVDDLSGLRVGYEQIGREHRARRQKREPLAVGADRGTNIQIRAQAFAFDDDAPQFGVAHVRGCGIGAANRVVPVGRQLFRRDPEHFFNRDVGIACRRTHRQHAPDHIVAKSSCDVRPERLPPAVREIFRVVEIRNRRKRVFPFCLG